MNKITLDYRYLFHTPVTIENYINKDDIVNADVTKFVILPVTYIIYNKIYDWVFYE